MNVRREISYIVRRARAGDARVVSIGPLVLFSSRAGDAWMLDPADGRAQPLARGGDVLPTPVLETDDRFSVRWDARFEVEDGLFVVIEPTGRVRAIAGYPTDAIAQACHRVIGR